MATPSASFTGFRQIRFNNLPLFIRKIASITKPIPVIIVSDGRIPHVHLQNRSASFWNHIRIRSSTQNRSLRPRFETSSEVVRAYWGVENRLHWCLDVVMNEDQARSRMENAPENLAILRHMALNIMRKDPSKGSLRIKFNRVV